MTRRRLLTLLAAGAMAGATAGTLTGWDRIWRTWGEWYRLEGYGREPLVRLRRHFDWLPVDATVFKQYLDDYQSNYGPVSRFSILQPDFYVRFLLSTNFFQLGADAERGQVAVQYARFYEPKSGACYNPLAQPPPSDVELAASSQSVRLVAN